jgi:hypothetical protein
MDNFQEKLEEIQCVYSINRMILNIASNYDLFKFLIGEKSAFCDFKKFTYLWHKNDANLAKVMGDFLHKRADTIYIQAVEGAKQLYALQETIVKYDYSQYKIEYIHGDKQIFNKFQKNFHFSKKQTLSRPGQYSGDAVLIAFPKDKLFVKPTKNLEKALNETKAYELAVEMGLQDYLLPSCVVKISKNSTDEPTYSVITAILPYDAVSLDEIDRRPGVADGILTALIEKGDSHKLALFDYLIDNSDVHKNNIYFCNNKVILIDRTEAFLKKDAGFIPGYLRKSSYKVNKQLPVLKNDNILRQWLGQLSLGSHQRIIDDLLKSKQNIDIQINKMWETYYVS